MNTEVLLKYQYFGPTDIAIELIKAIELATGF